MDRRSFILGMAALGTTLGGCNPDPSAFRVRLLKNSIPNQLPNQFKKQLKQDIKLDFKPVDQLQDLFNALQAWKQKPNTAQNSPGLPFISQSPELVPDLITMGDYWLSTAIRQQLIQPLDPKSWQLWTQLPDRWRNLVTRNNQVWGAPYRWGATVIAYRADIFRDRNLQPPQDWSDLWREDLRGRIALLDQPRETIGLTLKKLGQSYNTADLSKVPTLEAELQSLNRQAKVYSSTTALQSLVIDDVWVAVTWSTDFFQAAKRNPAIAAIFPNSGSALFADLWVRPASVQSNSPIADWINFCWTPDVAPQLSLISQAASPILSTLDANTFPDQLRQNPLLVPKPELLDRSEFLEPISDTTIEQYRSLWAKIRRSA
ncbi:MAG: extracellular solute-binding protein [Leptolyngbya sp. Prado105]|nr:extracellular solute-binding protein [Leptolyngbya sp. Prado105]